MPQVFQALRCFRCLAFQVHQVKKAKTWECKLCGEKQSFKRHYGIGTGKECRLHVQKLNEIRSEIPNPNICDENSDDEFENSGNNTKNKEEITISKTKSKWCNYVEKTDEANATIIDEENETLFGKKVLLELPKKRKKIYNINKRNAYINNESGIVYDDDVTNKSMPVSNDITTTSKKSIKKFVPPTTKTKSKWTEYNESENINNHTDVISNSDLFDNTKSKSSMLVKVETNNYHNTDEPSFTTNHRVFSNDKNKNINYNRRPVSETLKQNSKWTDFIDNNNFKNKQPECHSSEDFKYFPPRSGNISNLFSLCDDNDLDSVLDI